MRVLEHQPPVIPAISDSDPVIFLAGPIQGAPFWQTEAIKTIELLQPFDPKTHVANPRRNELDESDFVYSAQVAWEKHHLKRAARHGAIIFWFAARDLSEPYEEGRSYAQTSRVEYGRVFGWLDQKMPVHLAVGIEPGYEGSERYFRSCADEYRIPVFDTLEDVCMEAMRKVHNG